jgi:hypothetical protein
MAAKQTAPTGSWQLLQNCTQLVQKYFWAYLVLLITPSVILDISGQFITNEKGQIVTTAPTIWYALFGFGIAYSIVTSVVALRFTLAALRNKELSVNEAFAQGLPLLGRYIVVSFALALLFVGGLILFIVPGLVVLQRYFLAPYIAIDKNLGVKQSLQASHKLVKARYGFVWGTLGVSFLVIMLVSVAASALGYVGSLLAALGGTVVGILPVARYYDFTKLPKG